MVGPGKSNQSWKNGGLAVSKETVPGDGKSFKQDMEKLAEWPALSCVAVSPFPVLSLFRHSVHWE